jgi:hypothetical protein
MTFLINLINPPPTQGDIKDHYRFFNSVTNSLQGLTSVSNPSVVTNANYATLGPHGVTPTTQANGDNYEFIKNWFVVGSTAAAYTITPTLYLLNSTITSASLQYVHVVVSSFNGKPFYFYQRQTDTVRNYQNNKFTYGLMIQNNQNKAIKLRMDMYTFYNPTFNLSEGATFFLQPGLNNLTSTITTQSLHNMTVAAGNYTEFRFNFIDLIDGTADIELYLTKCEVGQISTPFSG